MRLVGRIKEEGLNGYIIQPAVIARGTSATVERQKASVSQQQPPNPTISAGPGWALQFYSKVSMDTNRWASQVDRHGSDMLAITKLVDVRVMSSFLSSSSVIPVSLTSPPLFIFILDRLILK